MFDARIAGSWPDSIVEAIAEFRQGDVIPWPVDTAYVAQTPHVLYGDPTTDETEPPGTQYLTSFEPAPQLAVITSQTCDIDEQGLPRRKPWIQYAPIFNAEDGGRRGLFTWPLDGGSLPPGEWYADLRFEGSAEKGILVGVAPVRGFATEAAANEFGRHLGHLRSRPAFANHLVETVTEHLRQFRKDATQGQKNRFKREVTEVRLQIPDGSRLEPHAVRLVVLHAAEPTVEMREWFESWYDAALPDAAKVGIELHAVHNIDATKLNYHDIKDLAILDLSG